MAGLAGVVLTAIGVYLTFIQIRRTATATEAATRAAVEALNESRDRYSRYLIAQVSKFYSEARIHVESREWMLACGRANDIADLISQFTGTDDDPGEAIP